MAVKYDKNEHEFVSMAVNSKQLKAAVAKADSAYQALKEANAEVVAVKTAEMQKAGLIEAGYVPTIGRSKFTGEWQVMVLRGTTDPVASPDTGRRVRSGNKASV